ncbi:hypothetical protein HELRODRAFT_185175 [Helobdella robusta]|uniref:RNA helicase n=1 Tax=Helobdella robusta TaxID=6412 RepID=T1FMH0_HELRO|nr:hypothetical protein HELRODRAFT_185175 [Helobdella robusta]ESN93081.1 hypothetical protein HELRODRAFT_185175 [Helobdella robusta]
MDVLPFSSGTSSNDDISFESLGVVQVLCEACQRLKWSKPTPIQKETIPVALLGKDIIGLAETGSGKTGAFAIPILQDLLQKQSRLFALILTPTRELAFQINETFEALGAGMKLKCAVIIGGVNMMEQSIMLAKKPHIIIATPGRLLDQLEGDTGFNLNSLQYLVLDEADRILNLDFEAEVNKILKMIPKKRKTYLFSATMTEKVSKLQRASLKNPVKVEVSNKYQTSSSLTQHYLFIPYRYKLENLVYLLNELSGNSVIIFIENCAKTQVIWLTLRNLGFTAFQLHGKMAQNKRLESLSKFKENDRSILVCTDVASRGLDIAHVDVVVVYNMPTRTKDYIHRVGRTARAGRSGKAYIFVTQYDVEDYLKIEKLLGYQIPKHTIPQDDVLCLQERCAEATRAAKYQLAEAEKKGTKQKRIKDSNKGENDDTEEASGVRKKFKRKK